MNDAGLIKEMCKKVYTKNLAHTEYSIKDSLPSFTFSIICLILLHHYISSLCCLKCIYLQCLLHGGLDNYTAVSSVSVSNSTLPSSSCHLFPLCHHHENLQKEWPLFSLFLHSHSFLISWKSGFYSTVKFMSPMASFLLIIKDFCSSYMFDYVWPYDIMSTP